MKHTRLLVVFLFVLFLPLSWYKMYSDSSKEESVYQSYLKNAREKAELQILKEATQDYQAALALHNSSEIQLELAQMYYDNRRYDIYEALCNQTINDYPYEIDAYERLAQYYYDLSSYSDVLSIRETINKRELKSTLINDLYQSIKYSYSYNGTYKVSELSNFHSGYARIRTQEGKIGYITESGQRAVNYIYDEGSIISNYGIAGITTSEGESYIIDYFGDKVNADPQKRKITYIGTINDPYFPVVLDNNYYVSDYSFNLSNTSYDYIGAFTSGRAAAKKGTEWFFIDGNGNRISDKTYEDIILDEGGIAFCRSRSFVKIKDHYIMIDFDENQIGTQVFENAINFVQSNGPTSVKVNGKWGFINDTGDIVLEFQYEDARPFSRGLAGVKGADGWNYIDESGNIVIPGPFQEVRDFSATGTSFVKQEDVWRMIRLYD
ncbi:MAG: WG repeat-containing protein [Clostridiales bacterium]|nr:WG repeat-containing protein [Clostridiales bacterium]